MNPFASDIIKLNKEEMDISKTPEYIALQKLLLGKDQRKVKLNTQINLFEIDLTTQNNQRRIKIPICIDGCNCKIFDIFDLFLSNTIDCSNCKKIADKTKKNICIESQYFQFCQGICPKSYSCSFILEKFIFHSYSINQPYAVELLKKNENQQFLDKIINQSGNFDFMPLLQQLEDQNLKFSSQNQRVIPILSIQCLYNANKIKIAVRLRDCKHLECYEYTSILELIDKNNKKPESFRLSTVNCFSIGCDAKIPLNFSELENVLIFDKRITESINQASDFAITLQFEPIKNIFQDQLIQKDNTFNSYIQQDDIIPIQETQLLYKYMANCVDVELDYNLKSFLQFSNYQIVKVIEQNGDLIQFPARCIKCNLNICADLRLFVFQYIRQNTKIQKYYSCPACNYKHTNVNNITQIVYFDKYLAQLSLKIPLDKFKYNGDAKLIQLFKQTQQINLQNIMKQYRLDQQIPYKDYRSCLGKQELKNPLLLLKCQNKSYIEYAELVDYLKNNEYSLQNFQLCQCCNNLQIEDFYFDIDFPKILIKLKDGLTLWDANIRSVIIRMNKSTDGIFQIPDKLFIQKQSLQLPQQQQQLQQQKQQFNFITGKFE